VPADEPGHRLSFNIAHTHGFVACVVTVDAPVGIDVERTDRLTDFDALAARFFSAPEVDAMKGRDDQARRVRFFELWTLKEAILKATGKGLSEPLRSMTFDFDSDATIRFLPTTGIDPGEWTFSLYSPTPLVRMAVAVNRPKSHVRVHCNEDG
jgi:4'-phosphopantetheinyl transferase